MKSLTLALVMLLTFLVSGCATTGKMPVPETPKQAGTFALVDYGLAGEIANVYLNYPLCTKPLTVVPCKTEAVAQKVKEADKAAHDAAIAAYNAAGSQSKYENYVEKRDELKRVSAEANKEAKTGGSE